MIATALVFLTLCGITIAAVFAFGWAAKNGQFRDQDAAARVVFDPDEPEGEATDAFPGFHPPAASEEQPGDRR
jgi:cbb3-type cytochrome oxidase maturation protein